MRVIVSSTPTLFAAVAVLVLAGCSRSIGSAGSSPDASSGPTAAVNANDITRYPYEKKLKDVSATLLKDGIARKSPPDGLPITTLPKGTTVTQIAQTSNAYLVTFDDPSGGAHKMGWIIENAFTSAPAVADNGGGGGGHGGGGGGGGGHGGGGGGGGGSGSSSGGSAPSAPGGNTIFIQPVNGQCPAGFVKGSVGCHRTCSADGDCPSNTKCKSGVVGATKVCTTG